MRRSFAFRGRHASQGLRNESHREGLCHRQRSNPARPFLSPQDRAPRPRPPRSPPARHAPRRRTRRSLSSDIQKPVAAIKIWNMVVSFSNAAKCPSPLMAAPVPPIAIPLLSTEMSTVFGAQPEIAPADDMHVSRTNTWLPVVGGLTRFVALESKTTKRPSALTACCEELLTPFAVPAALWDTLVVEAMQPATGPPEELQVSRIQTVLVKPPPGAGVCVLNTMNRPS